MAVIIGFWPYSLTTELNYLQKNKSGHTKLNKLKDEEGGKKWHYIHKKTINAFWADMIDRLGGTK